MAKRVVVPELAIFVRDSADTLTHVGRTCFDSIEDLLLLHLNFVVHLGDKTDSVASCDVTDDVSSS